ncbi:hypothetical protein [Halobacterium hubeiense]|uniref:hypothetical protein n=1 Tax=Halobacterium hubeiense TaxID=1407499 RepID=UPI003C7656AA
MALRAVITVLSVVFVLVLLAATIGPVLPQITGALMATGDYNTSWLAGESLVNSLVESWFQMILVGVFGIMLWAVAYVLRRELTQGGF